MTPSFYYFDVVLIQFWTSEVTRDDERMEQKWQPDAGMEEHQYLLRAQSLDYMCHEKRK